MAMKRISLSSTLLITAALALGGCKSQLDGKKAAKVQDAPKAAAAKGDAAKPVAAAASKLNLIKAKSSVGFVGAKVTGDHSGGFGDISGHAQLDAKNQLTGLDILIKTDSVTSDAEKLTSHLKSPDFFDVAKFPKSTFKSSKVVAKAGDKGATHEIQGTLELHGVQKLITFPATLQAQAKHAGVSAEFKINRKDFGIVYPGRKDDLIKDDVLLKINLHFGA